MRLGDVVKLKNYNHQGKIINIHGDLIDVLSNDGIITTYDKKFLEVISKREVIKGIYKMSSAPLEIGQFHNEYRIMDFEVDKIICINKNTNKRHEFEIADFCLKINGFTFSHIIDEVIKYEHVLLICPKEKFFMPETEVSLDEISSIVERSKQSSIVDQHAFGKLEVITDVTYGVRKKKNPYYINMMISKNPPVVKTIEKKHDFINWKFYAGLMSNNTYGTQRSHTYNPNYYKIHIADTGNYVDWRAPICELYYNYKNVKNLELDYFNVNEATKYELYRKENLNTAPVKYNHKTIFRGEFIKDETANIYYYDPSIDLSRQKSKILQAALKRNKTNNDIHEIIESIQPEQYEMINKPLDAQLILQGCAGSGKTMILYHRLSYMLYNGFNINDGIVLTPNQLLNDSIKVLLGELKLGDLSVNVFDDYLRKLITEYLECKYDKVINEKDFEENLIEKTLSIGTRLLNAIYTDLKKSYEDIDFMKMSSWDKMQYVKDCLNSYNDFINNTIQKCENLYDIEKKYKDLFDRKNVLIAQLKMYMNNKYLNLDCIHMSGLSKEFNDLVEKLNVNNYNILLELRDFSRFYEQLYNYMKINLLVVREKIRSNNNDIYDVINIINKKYKMQYDLKQFYAEFQSAKKYNSKSRVGKFISNEPKHIKALSKIIDIKGEEFERKLNLELFSTEYIDSFLSKENDFDSYLRLIDIIEMKEKMNKLNEPINFFTEFYLIIFDYYNLKEKKQDHIFGKVNVFKDDYVILQNKFNSISKDISKYIFGLNLDFVIKHDYSMKIDLTINKLVDCRNKMISKYIYKNYEMLLSKLSNYEINESIILKLISCYLYYGPRKINDKYIFVDEAQDFNINYYKIINLINNNPIFNIFGDIHQKINHSGLNGWYEIVELKNAVIYEVYDNYRNPIEICTYCNKLFNYKMLPIADETGTVKVLSLDEFIKKINMIDLSDKVALICDKNLNLSPILQRIKQPFENGGIAKNRISFLSPLEAKGLEFKTVFVYDKGMSAQSKYVSYTRCLENLYILK